MKKNILIAIGLVIIIIIAVTVVYYFDKAQNKSLNIKEAPSTDNIDALKSSNQAAIDSAASVNSVVIRDIDSTDHVRGDLSAPVHIIVYNDFEDSFGAQFAETLDTAMEEFGEKIAIAYRHFPLRGNANAVAAALASECAAEQDMFWQMHDDLFLANRENSLGEASIASSAEELELDMEKFNICYESEKYITKVQKHLDEGRKYGVSGTPGGFVNGEPIPGAYPFEDFTDSQDREREGLKTIIERHLNKQPITK